MGSLYLGYMKRKAVSIPILEVSAKGNFTFSGSTTEASSASSHTFEEVSEKAAKLRKLFGSNNLNLHRSPSFIKLLDGTEAMVGTSFEDRTFDQLLSALQIQRLADALLPLSGNPQAHEKLAETLNGSINLLCRNRSKAKDTLWELEMHRILSNLEFNTQFAEPDLIVTLADISTGVACKKLYSEANVEKVLSQAVCQIEQNCKSGIVALDIEDLLPENAVLKVPDFYDMSTCLNQHNNSFMKRHERHIRKYLEPGRAISVVVSCAAIVDIFDRTPRFHNARQTTIWNIPDHSASRTVQVEAMLLAMLSTHAA